MSAPRKEEKILQEDKNLLQEAGIGALAGILQGIQTSLADLSASKIIGSANHPLLAVLRTELRRAQLTISG